ncbi:MAG: diguanylate cyclase [Campylobacterota bacterium]|nr:diguanylate cyclase [Campylobacterota bacterium]
MNSSKNSEIEISNSNSVQKDIVAYLSIINTHKIASLSHYDNLIQNTQVMEILKKFKYETSENEKTFLRGELFRLLNKKYSKLKELGIRQFHFHTQDGESLLRFHRPTKNGDELSNIRVSVKNANEQLEPFYGFEGGKVFPGFRYVFPIIYENDHLGSVEFSIPFDLIEEKLQLVLPKIGYQLHLDKNTSYSKVFSNYKDFFVPSPLIKNHYIESVKISDVEKKILNNEEITAIQTKLKPHIEDENIDMDANFSISLKDNNRGYRVSFINIMETNGKNTAHLVSYNRFSQLLTIEEKYLVFKVLIILATLIIFILVYIVYRQINKIVAKNKNIQQLLDYQDNLVVLTDGTNMTFANLKFFNFFGYENLSEFKKHHECVCEYFIRSDRFFHLGKVGDSENWVEAIRNLPESKRVVSILSHDFEVHLFSVSVNKFDNKMKIINFSDISQTMKNFIELEEKIIHDKLTGTLNREYFDKNFKTLLHKYHTEDAHLALGMIDIDNFKDVNDTYGHDVGDDVLVHFVKTIEKYSRDEDILIRWGGEEFIIILKVDSKDSLKKALEHIRKVIEIENFPTVGHKTCSIGGTIYVDGEQILQTIKRADIGVYNAKKYGKNRVVVEE